MDPRTSYDVKFYCLKFMSEPEKIVRGTENASGGLKDDPLTLAAAGVLAYVTETIGHELVGHGGACLASGGHVTALAPLWMRCSVVTPSMVLGGPLFNFIVAAGAAALLMRRRQASAFSYLLWLAFIFNFLIACGYLVVGGALRFGDWSVLFADISPSWIWRIGAVAVGIGGYVFGLHVAEGLYARISGPAKDYRQAFVRRTLIPAVAAAIVALAAELAGGRLAPLALALPLACTLIVGWSVSRTDPSHLPTHEGSSFIVRINRRWQISALVLALIFVWVIGPAPGSG